MITNTMTPPPLSWLGIFRFGLAQMAIGAIVVLTTSTLNRVMVVELAMPAMLPGALVGFHYAVQILRPRWGYGSDVGGRRTPWIVGGMIVLASGGALAAVATAWMGVSPGAGIALSLLAFLLIGGGVGACGTTLLVLLAVRVDDRRRAAAATIVWLMMIAGLAITASVAGHLLDPFSPERLIAVTAGVSGIAVVLTVIAIWGVEGPHVRRPAPPQETPSQETGPKFMEAMGQVWSEPESRKFAIFVFVSMLAYSAQDLILEPFAGTVFGMTPGESTKLSGLQHGGVFTGMVLVALVCSGYARGRFGSLKAWVIGGCLASAGALFALAAGGIIGSGFPLNAAVFALGAANGAFAVAAIGSMMGLVRRGREKREGTRMGLWGAAQAIAFGIGGFIGAAAVDVLRWLTETPAVAYTAVFAAEGALFILSACLAARVGGRAEAAALGMTPEPSSP